MLKAKTVLILGAGASMDYGYPSGYSLLLAIRTKCVGVANGSDFSGFENTGGIKQADFKRLIEVIDSVNFESIDALLERYPEFMSIGKPLIALSLMPHEQKDPAFDREKRGENWMHYLFKQMVGQTLEQFAKNDLSVITFNYDRCFDNFLRRQVRDWYRVSDADVSAAIKGMEINHVHGVLGSLSDIPYGSLDLRRGSQVAHRAGSGIDIIHEAHSDSPAFQKARATLQSANRIGILGFGFHPTNLDRLDVGNTIKGKPIFATVKGLHPPEWSAMESRVVPVGYGNLHVVNGTCLDLLRQTTLLY